MKKPLVLFTFCLVLLTNVHAQSYSEKAEMYDTHRYTRQFDDPYSPFISAVASYFIPGLGQMICDEPSRGLSFLGGYVACGGLLAYGYYKMYNSMLDDFWYSNPTEPMKVKGLGKIALGAIGMAGIGLWSVFDAVQVAKVNNMYYQDHYKKTGDIQLEIAPYAEPISMFKQVTVPVGLTLRATF